MAVTALRTASRAARDYRPGMKPTSFDRP